MLPTNTIGQYSVNGSFFFFNGEATFFLGLKIKVRQCNGVFLKHCGHF